MMTRPCDMLPPARGSLTMGAPLKDLVWFRAGGPAEILFRPADADDLAAFLAAKPADLRVSVIGVGSNLLVRDGGIPGAVVRLSSAFGKIETDGLRVRAGAAALDGAVARAAANAGIAGLEFLRGVPGTIGGALKMNAGCYGSEIKDVFVEAVAIDEKGNKIRLSSDDMDFTYRKAQGARDGLIFIEAVFEGRKDDPAAIRARMEELSANREASQPIKSRTGGSDLQESARPQGLAAGGSGRLPRLDDRRGAGQREAHQLPDQHRRCQRRRPRSAWAKKCASRVQEKSGVTLEWEIKRVGDGMTQFRKIAVLMGGMSAEREVSLVVRPWRARSACAKRASMPTPLDPGPNPGQQLFDAKPDAVFNALHGRFGEDGTVQGLLELMRIPYTHSGVLSSALAMHKERTKDVYRAAGLPVVHSIVADRREVAKAHLMEPPYVIKPVNEGSSVGIYIIRKGDNRPPAELGTDTWNLSNEMMVEEFVPGRELTVSR